MRENIRIFIFQQKAGLLLRHLLHTRMLILAGRNPFFLVANHIACGNVTVLEKVIDEQLTTETLYTHAQLL